MAHWSRLFQALDKMSQLLLSVKSNGEGLKQVPSKYIVICTAKTNFAPQNLVSKYTAVLSFKGQAWLVEIKLQTTRDLDDSYPLCTKVINTWWCLTSKCLHAPATFHSET